MNNNKNGKNKDHLPLQNLDLHLNAEDSGECCLYDYIDITLKFGRILFFGVSYSIVPSNLNCSEFTIKNNHRFQIFLRLLHSFFFLFLIIPFITERVLATPCCLINFIKNGLHIVLIFCMMTGYYCLEIKGRKANGGMAGIFRQCVLLQSKFKEAGLRFPNRAKIKIFGWMTSLGICLICIVRQCIFATKHVPWYGGYARQFSKTVSLGLWTPSNETTSKTTQIILGTFGIFTSGVISNYWFFVQLVHFSFAVTMWITFDKLNTGLRNRYFKTENLEEVVELHFHSTKLLKFVNQLISPLTFWSILFDITCLCFWTNYIAFDFTIRPIYIAGVCFFVKTGVELILIVDVNSKAYEISEWLEESCANSEKLPPMDLMKFTVFTSQIYSKETTGFKGLNLFVVTSHLAIAVVGIIITYTVAVNQFCERN